MNLSEFTGSINETQDRGKGAGRSLIWGGNRYMYLAGCKKRFRTINVLEEHEFYCDECHRVYELEEEQEEN